MEILILCFIWTYFKYIKYFEGDLIYGEKGEATKIAVS